MKTLVARAVNSPPPFVLDLIKRLVVRGAPTLEIGCGAGLFRKEIPGRYIGTDISAEEYYPVVPRKIDVQCDAMALPFWSHNFGLVFSMSVINRIPDIGRALWEAHRVLDHRGRLLIITYDWTQLRAQARLYPRECQAFTMRELRTKMREVGFRNVKMHWPPLPPARDSVRAILYRLPFMDTIRNWRQCWRIIEGRK